MSTKVKERLKKLALETDHEIRFIFDNLLEKHSGKTCDEAIEELTDDQVRALILGIKKKKKKKAIEIPMEA